MKGRAALFVLLACSCGEVSDESELGAAPFFPVPECAHLEQRACDIRAVACQTQILALAACLRGEEPGELPSVELMTPAEVRTYYESAAEEDDGPDPTHYEHALSSLGLVAPGAFSDESRITDQVDFLGGFYEFTTKRLVIVDRDEAGLEPLPGSAILLHEFVHYLQDRELDLAAYYEAEADSDDSRLALVSLVEGEAEFYEWRYVAALAGIDGAEVDWKKTFQNLIVEDELGMLEEESPYLERYRTFRYSFGSRYVHWLHERGGSAAVHEAYASPPLTTRTLMASATEPVVDLDPAEFAEPLPPPEWSLFYAPTSLGAWGVFLLALPAAGIDAARSLALAWRGDRLWI
ncbi:MAG TPA: hypothetical protein VGK73_22900, partial [Polyangiaceae bacterium]